MLYHFDVANAIYSSRNLGKCDGILILILMIKIKKQYNIAHGNIFDIPMEIKPPKTIRKYCFNSYCLLF